MRLLCLILFVCAGLVQAGSFDSYRWRLGFKLGADEYQPTLKIEYTYNADGADNTDLALPRDPNLHVFSMQFKVDGKKVDGLETHAVTYWGNGEKVPVFMPPTGNKKVTATVIYTLANPFVIPAAPTALSVACKKLEVGFAPIVGFQMSGHFVGPQAKFKRTKVAARPGEPHFVFGFTLKKTKPATETSLLFLYPKIFQFSFDNLVGAVEGLEGNIGADNRAGGGNLSEGNNLKPYTMVFYRENPNRDWSYIPTWLQQETIYFPFGIEPGGRTKTRSLFLGSRDDAKDLLTWKYSDHDDSFFDDFPTEMDVEFDGTFPVVERFREHFVKAVKVDQDGNRLIATEKDDVYSPAMANLILATELTKRLKIRAVPAFITNQPANMLGRLPLGGFSKVVTAFSVKGNWYFLDAANADWTLKNSFEKMTGKNALILDGASLRAASF